MAKSITIRLPDDVADWLDRKRKRTGIPKVRTIVDALREARAREAKINPNK